LKNQQKHANVGGAYIAPVAPREEFFMGHQPINELQQPGMATGYGIPENASGAHSLGGFGQGYTSGATTILPSSTYQTSSYAT